MFDGLSPCRRATAQPPTGASPSRPLVRRAPERSANHLRGSPVAPREGDNGADVLAYWLPSGDERYVDRLEAVRTATENMSKLDETRDTTRNNMEPGAGVEPATY